MEEKPIERIFTNWPVVAKHIGPENLKLVSALQALHDNDDPDEWADELNDIAQHWGLS